MTEEIAKKTPETVFRAILQHGTIVIDMDEFLEKLVIRKKVSLFLREWLSVTAVDYGIDFPELFDSNCNFDASQIAHVKDSGVSREDLRPSKTLPGNPFLLAKIFHSTPQIKKKPPTLEISKNNGGTALRSFSCL